MKSPVITVSLSFIPSIFVKSEQKDLNFSLFGTVSVKYSVIPLVKSPSKYDDSENFGKVARFLFSDCIKPLSRFITSSAANTPKTISRQTTEFITLNSSS